MQNLIPYLIVFFIYLAVAIDFWRVAKTPEKNLKLHAAMIALALALHGWLLFTTLFSNAGLNMGLYLALSAILWLTVLIYWLVNLKHSLYSLQAFVLPLAAVFSLLPPLANKTTLWRPMARIYYSFMLESHWLLIAYLRLPPCTHC